MLIRRHAAALVLNVWLLAAGVAQAHFLWVLSDSDAKVPGIRVFFSESASPDDPDLLNRVTHAKAWAISSRRGEDPQPLQLEKKDDALVAELPPGLRDAPVVLQCTYGTLTRGTETFLLNYYAKTYAQSLPGTWRRVNNENLIPLEISPRVEGKDLSLTVLWQGKILPEAVVTIEGPGIEKKLEGPADKDGVFRCTLAEAGVFSIRAKHTEAKGGEHDGKAYASVRHYSTLSLRYQPSSLNPADHAWPELAKGVTSFGGAIAGDYLYVYGGHYGAAHSYSSEEQSGDFYRLNLREPHGWESLAGGPKATGLALVPWHGQLYRVGGFTAKNSEKEEQSLWSQTDFARFDPETKQWTALEPLPAGRSSHDAAVVGNTLYVVGGWNMQGKEATTWHDTALAMDLSVPSPTWKAIPNPPFHRRALALAAWNDKLYCIGGMQEQGGPTTAVAVFDPAANAWSEGPALVGTDRMDGFGSSAFACGGRLYATTMSGSVQRLNSSGEAWEYAGQLQKPRFFHRLLAWQSDRLVVVGGASMTTGKITALELLPVGTVQTAAK